MVNFKLTIPVLPAEGSVRGRIAAVRSDEWTIDWLDTLRQQGFEILSLPDYQEVPADLRCEPEVHLAFTAAVAQAIRDIGGTQYIASGNAASLYVMLEGQQLRTLGQHLNVPTWIWWYDDPRYPMHPLLQNKIVLVYPFLQLIRGPEFHHFMLDAAMTQSFAQDRFFANVHHLPVATSPQRFHPPQHAQTRSGAVMIGNAYPSAGTRAYTKTFLQEADYEQLFVPLLALKRSSLQEDLATLLRRLAQQQDLADHPIVRAFESPWEPQHFDLAYRAWHVYTFMACDIRNEAIAACRAHLGDLMELHGHNWDKIGVPCPGMLHGMNKQLKAYHRRAIGLTGSHGQLQTGLPFRIWEIAASELVVVSQNTAELGHYFDIGSECLAFENAEQAVAHTDRLLGDPDFAKEVARKGQQRVMRDHLWINRIAVLMQHVGIEIN